MARATSPYQPEDYGQSSSGEWQELRGELVALLDQVETQVARTARPERAYDGLAEQMRDLRHQVTAAEPDTRHREALKSVQRAIDKFSDRPEPAMAANPRDSLEAAIQQIRARHFPSAPAPAPAPERTAPRHSVVAEPEAPRFGELATAVGGISSRLERLEGELKTTAKGQTANVREIAEQVGQLSQVVELLAGAVGEAGQVKRLETHIASLAKLIADGPKVDVDSLNERLDDVTATVGRLADLQVQFANRVEAPRDGLTDAMKAIEDGVRNIYDRVDTIERTMAMPPAELETVIVELGKVAQAIKSPQQPQGLIELIDALNDRISDIEGRGTEIGGLKLDMEALKQTVTTALDTRFSTIEEKIEELSDRVAEQKPTELSLGQLEAQVRQLVARMDQTGEQLTGLAKLYSAPPEVALPDFDKLAEMVATRTSAALKQAETPAAGRLDEAGYAEIEKRLGKVMQAAAKEKPADDTVVLEATIREVNERLKRLEVSLEKKPEPAIAVQPQVPVAKPPVETRLEVKPTPAPKASPVAALVEVLADEPVISARPVEPEDIMPADPSMDAPLVDKPFGDPNPLRAALEAKNGPRHRSAPQPGEEPPAKAVFDPNLAERPPQPKSTLDLPEEEVFGPASGRDADSAAEPLPSRNTFIEAHRRAARLAATNKSLPTVADNGSLISRAFSRFQASGATDTPAVSMPVKPSLEKPKRKVAEPKASEIKAEEPKKEKPAAQPRKALNIPFLKPRPPRQLAGDKDPPSEWKSDEPAPRVLPVAPEPSRVALGAEETSPVAEGAAKAQSFLLRHKQPILLAASVVAIACLTINLINQRMKPEEPAAPAVQAQTVGDASLEPVPLSAQGSAIQPKAEPRVVLDTLTTASIDGGTAQKFVPADPAPRMPQAFEAASALAAVDTVDVAKLSDGVEPLVESLESPVKVDRPPREIGPDQLLDAAANGDARAQFEVAAIYTEGRAVSEDLEAAAIWYERAAGQGFAPAQYRLGNLYENGRGVDKDLAQARLWYQRAAEAGNRMAMHNLAALYAGGGLGQQQFDAAAKWFEEAAVRGMKDSQFNLGMLYARGLGVKQDLPASYKWFSLAADRGDKDAVKARDDIAASLDAATVQKLIADVEAFRPQQIDLVANFAPIGTWSQAFDPGAPIVNTKVVMGVQKVLAVLGYDIGTPDGVAGAKTAEAIKSFERATGMSEKGEINPRLLAVLGSQPV